MNIRLRLWFGPSNIVLVLLAISWLVERFYDQLAPVNCSTVIGISLTSFTAWFCSALTRANFYAERISNNFEFYRARLALRGITLESAPGGQDEAPCESEYLFLAPTVRVKLGAIRSWRMIRAIYNEKISLPELERYSKWEKSKVPVI